MDAVEQCKGALLGLAVGNVLGLAWEGKSKREVAAQEPLAIPRQERRRLPDDDTAMTLVLARHLAAHPRGIQPEALLAEYAEWLRTNGKGAGGLTRAVLRLALSGHPGAARLIWLERGGRKGMVMGNGSVMRCAPLAVRYRADLDRAIDQAQIDASLTHWDERCRQASAAGVILLAGHLNGQADAVARAAALLEERGADPEVLEALKGADVGPDFPERFKLDGHGAGSALVALRAMRWASSHAPDFAESLMRLLRAGGDTDTNGAVAGAVLGARFPDGMPEEWLACVRDRDELAALGEKLSAIEA